jgi:hypothetical protein
MKGRELRFIGNARKLALLAEKITGAGVIGFMADWRPSGDETDNWEYIVTI